MNAIHAAWRWITSLVRNCIAFALVAVAAGVGISASVLVIAAIACCLLAVAIGILAFLVYVDSSGRVARFIERSKAAGETPAAPAKAAS